MKKIIALILAVTMLMNVNVYGVQKEEEENNVSAAKSSVLMEASSGTIIKAGK